MLSKKFADSYYENQVDALKDKVRNSSYPTPFTYIKVREDINKAAYLKDFARQQYFTHIYSMSLFISVCYIVPMAMMAGLIYKYNPYLGVSVIAATVAAYLYYVFASIVDYYE